MSRSLGSMKAHFSQRSDNTTWGGCTTRATSTFALRPLRELAGDQDEQWVTSFADMLSYARSKGWMTDAEHVRAHCIRGAATPHDL